MYGCHSGRPPANMYMWAPYGLQRGYMGMKWALGKLSGPSMISVTWVPYRKPMWADHIGPIRDMSRQSRHWVKVCKLCGHHVVSLT